jgi:hypothetical protein
VNASSWCRDVAALHSLPVSAEHPLVYVAPACIAEAAGAVEDLLLAARGAAAFHVFRLPRAADVKDLGQGAEQFLPRVFVEATGEG